jgi:hypothetical protein
MPRDIITVIGVRSLKIWKEKRERREEKEERETGEKEVFWNRVTLYDFVLSRNCWVINGNMQRGWR